MHYLRWAKTHKRARYELAVSGVPPITTDELSDDPLPQSLDVVGDYGDPTFIEHLVRLYHVDTAQVIPVPGTSSANFIALAATCRHGDTILLEYPRYDPLERAADFLDLGIIPLNRAPDAAYDIPMDRLDAGLEQGAKAVVLTNLHNPSGQCLSQETIKSIARRCERHGATLIVDEVYLDAVHLTSDRPRWTAASLAENVIATGSLTKIYGLGGLRAGWILTSSAYAERARDVMDLLSVENAAPVASIANHALANMVKLEDRYRRFHIQNRPVFQEWLASEPRLSGYENSGALFEWVKLPESLSADRLSDHLATTHDTQIVPGSFFGADDHIRISLAASHGDLTEGLARIAAGIADLSAE